jgi:hypothetical protein
MPKDETVDSDGSIEDDGHTCPHPNLKDPSKPCKMVFKRTADLRRHIRVHLNEKPFECTDCGKSFVQRHALTVHRRTHTGERPFECDWEDCGKSFHDSSSLARHKRSHTCERRYTCKICTDDASVPDEVMQQARSAVKEEDGKKKNFALGQFTRKTTLRRHLLRFHQVMMDDDDNYVYCKDEQVEEMERKFGLKPAVKSKASKPASRAVKKKVKRARSITPESESESSVVDVEEGFIRSRSSSTSSGKVSRRILKDRDKNGLMVASTSTPFTKKNPTTMGKSTNSLNPTPTTFELPKSSPLQQQPLQKKKKKPRQVEPSPTLPTSSFVLGDVLYRNYPDFSDYSDGDLLGGYFTVETDADVWDLRTATPDHTSTPGDFSETESVASVPMSTSVGSQAELVVQLRKLLETLEAGETDRAKELFSSPGLQSAAPYLTVRSNPVSPLVQAPPCIPLVNTGGGKQWSFGGKQPISIAFPDSVYDEDTTLNVDDAYDSESSQAVDDFLERYTV